ncbi:MAG: GNAT family N-acetyltransferase [Kiloniellales bacterium]
MKPVIETAELRLLPVAMDDLDRLAALLWEREVRRYLTDDRRIPRPEVADYFLRSDALDADGLGLWTLWTADSRFAGCAGLLPITYAAPAELAIEGDIEPLLALLPGFWGRGLASRALAELTRYAFETLRLPRLVASADEPNDRAHRLMERGGFRRIGEGPGPKHRLVFYAKAAGDRAARRRPEAEIA